MTKLELKSGHEVIDTVDVADVESIFYCKPTDPYILTVLMNDGKRLYCDEVCPVQEEPVSEDLELTWKDIEKVCLIAREVHQFRGFWSESVYQEVLKRFKEKKGKEL